MKQLDLCSPSIRKRVCFFALHSTKILYQFQYICVRMIFYWIYVSRSTFPLNWCAITSAIDAIKGSKCSFPLISLSKFVRLFNWFDESTCLSSEPATFNRVKSTVPLKLQKTCAIFNYEWKIKEEYLFTNWLRCVIKCSNEQILFPKRFKVLAHPNRH